MGLLLTVRVLLRNDEYVKSLEQDIADANERAEYWKNQYKKLEFDYAKVSHVNAAWTAAITIFYTYQMILRWAKVVGD